MIIIGIAGTSDPVVKSVAAMKARKFATRLGEFPDVVLFTGGDGGIMKIVSEEFRKAGRMVVGIIPLEDEAIPQTSHRMNPYNTIVVKSGSTFQARSIMLVRSSHAFAVLGGGVGSMIEALLAYSMKVPLVVLTDTGYPSDMLAKIAEEGYFDHRRLTKVYFTKDPVMAAELVYRLALERAKRL